MCELAVDEGSNWLMVDTWEPMQKEYQPTALVLDHFDHEINTVRGGIEIGNGERKPVRIALLAGADLIHTMSTPGVWSQKDLDHILGKYGVSFILQQCLVYLSYGMILLTFYQSFIVERSGTDIDEALASLQPWKDNIYVIQQLIQNDVSSTKIRLFLRREMSVRYLIPSPVIHYIEQHRLYEDDGTSNEKGKERQ